MRFLIKSARLPCPSDWRAFVGQGMTILEQPVQIISCSASMWRYALYKEDKHYSHDDYDENEPDSSADDPVAVRGNEKLLGQSKITKGILDFLEV